MPQRRIHASPAHRQAAYHHRCQEALRQQLQKQGLPALPVLSNIPGTARWRQAITCAAHLLEVVGDEMEAYYEDRSEAWQESDRAEAFQERLEAVRDAQQAVEGLRDA
jgi:hypothetical protein